MLRPSPGLPTELIHLLQNFRLAGFSHAPLSRRFSSAATAYQNAKITSDDRSEQAAARSSFLEEPNEQHQPISASSRQPTFVSRSLLTHKRPPPLPPESSLFEDATPEYTTRTKDATPERRGPTDIILSLLEAKGSTDDEGALQLVFSFRKFEETIQEDERFVDIAWDRLKSDQLDHFLAWWELVPSRTTYASKHSAKKAKERFHDIERMLLAHPELGGNKAKSRRMVVLTKFGKTCASKGFFRWAKWTYTALSKTLAPKHFQAYWDDITAMDVTYAREQDAELGTPGELHKEANRLIRQRWNLILESMARSSALTSACQWALDGAPLFPLGIWESYILETTYVSLLDALDFRMTKSSNAKQHQGSLHRLLKQQLTERMLEQYPNANRARLGQFVSEEPGEDDQAPMAEDGLGLQYIESLTLGQARHEIGQALLSGPHGVKRLSANTAAGYISLCLRNSQKAPPWKIIDIPDLALPDKATNRAKGDRGQDVTARNFGKEASRLWTNALILYHLHMHQPGLAISTFRRGFLSVGTPSQVFDIPQLAKLPFDLSGLYRSMPSRYTLSLVYTALIRLEKRNNLQGIDSIYSTFLNTSYGANNECILSNYQVPDAANFQPFINAFCNANAPDRALQIIIDMQARSVHNSIHAYTILIGGYARTGDAQKVYDLLARLEGSTTPTTHWPELDSITGKLPAPNVITYTTIMKGFAMRRLEKLARNVQRRMEQFLGAEAVKWEYAYNGKLKETLAFLEMVELNIQRQRMGEQQQEGEQKADSMEVEADSDLE